MREDLEYGKSGRFRLKLQDLCYAWALMEEEEKGNLGNVVYVNKVGKITRTERYAALYTRWLIGRLLSGIVSQKKIQILHRHYPREKAQTPVLQKTLHNPSSTQK
jgi:hypothetical protein